MAVQGKVVPEGCVSWPMGHENLIISQEDTRLYMSTCLRRLPKSTTSTVLIFPMLVCTNLPLWIVNIALILHEKRFLITFNKRK